MENDQYTNIMNKLDELHGDFREFKGSTSVEIEVLKKEIDSSKFWENVKVVGVMPIMAVLHHYFGGK